MFVQVPLDAIIFFNYTVQPCVVCRLAEGALGLAVCPWWRQWRAPVPGQSLEGHTWCLFPTRHGPIDHNSPATSIKPIPYQLNPCHSNFEISMSHEILSKNLQNSRYMTSTSLPLSSIAISITESHQIAQAQFTLSKPSQLPWITFMAFMCLSLSSRRIC